MTDGFDGTLDGGGGVPLSFNPALIKYLGKFNKKEILPMSTLIISGMSASGSLPSLNAIGYKIHSIELDVPLDEVGSTDPSITISGAYTGSHTFHSTVKPDITFGHGEAIEITTSNFGTEYSAIVSYQKFGDQSRYMDANPDRAYIPVSTKLRKNAGLI